MSIGKKIKERRLNLNMTAEELAEKLGKHRSTVYRYENGDIDQLPISILEPLAQALNVEPSYFISDIRNNKVPELKSLEKEYITNFSQLDTSTKENVNLIIEYFKVLNEENQNKLVERSKELIESQLFKEKIEQTKYKDRIIKEQRDYIAALGGGVIEVPEGQEIGHIIKERGVPVKRKYKPL